MSTSWSEFINTLALSQSAEPLADNVIYPLPALSFLQIVGPDANKFLQGQLSCDVNSVTKDQSSLGSHCTPKGRMLSSFRLCQNDDNSYWLALHSSITEAAQKALAKYIVFSKAEISQSDKVAIGLHGAAAIKNLTTLFGDIPTADYQQKIIDTGVLICTSSQLQSYELYIDAAQATEVWDELAQGLSIKNAQQQKLIQHQLGLAFVEQATFDAHIPQTFNYQATPAVSFKKGCYTGQEIVARMQYLGKLKRHLYHYKVHSEAELSAGNAVYIEEKKQAIGDIVSTVKTAEKEWDILLILTEEGKAAEQLLVETVPLTQLQTVTLPYEIEVAKA